MKGFFKKNLNEIGDASTQPYPFTIDEYSSFSLLRIKFYFTTDKDVKYTAAFSEMPSSYKKEYEFAFVANDGTFTDIINKGEVFRVMSTIVKILEKGIEIINSKGGWKQIYFYPTKSFKGDERRKNLYQSYIIKNLPPNIEVNTGPKKVTFINLNPPQRKEMKDIQKIKEFFSQPMKAEEEETAVDMAKKQLDALGIKYEMSGNKFKPFKVIYKPYNEDLDALYDQEYELTRIYQNDKGKKNWEKLSQIREKGKRLEEFNRIVYEFNLGSAVEQSMDEAKFMSGMLLGKDFINAKLKNYPKAKAKVNQLIDMIGESKFTIEMAEWIFDFFNNAHFESPINEAKKEDKVDTITMDIPLFLRMLEYSREDASQDMDLHDVTEKAISLGKERGILQMDDYDEIIGSAEEIKEGMGNEVGDKVYFKNEVGEKYPPFKGYYGVIEDTTPASNYNMMATYQVVVYDENDNEIRTIKTDFTNLTSKAVNEAVNLKQAKLSSAEYQKAKKLKDFKSSDWKWNADEDLYTKVVKEATDYMKHRKSEDDYATKKPKQPAYTGKTDYQKRREAEKKLAETIFSKLKEAKSTPCWKGYEQKGMKKKDGRQVPNCVPKN